MKKKVVVDHKTDVHTTSYAAMEQKLRQAAREAIFAREKDMKQLDQGMSRDCTLQQLDQ